MACGCNKKKVARNSTTRRMPTLAQRAGTAKTYRSGSLTPKQQLQTQQKTTERTTV